MYHRFREYPLLAPFTREGTANAKGTRWAPKWIPGAQDKPSTALSPRVPIPGRLPANQSTIIKNNRQQRPGSPSRDLVTMPMLLHYLLIRHSVRELLHGSCIIHHRTEGCLPTIEGTVMIFKVELEATTTSSTSARAPMRWRLMRHDLNCHNDLGRNRLTWSAKFKTKSWYLLMVTLLLPTRIYHLLVFGSRAQCACLIATRSDT